MFNAHKHTKYKVNYKVKYPNHTAKMSETARWIHMCAFEYGFVLLLSLFSTLSVSYRQQNAYYLRYNDQDYTLQKVITFGEFQDCNSKDVQIDNQIFRNTVEKLIFYLFFDATGNLLLAKNPQKSSSQLEVISRSHLGVIREESRSQLNVNISNQNHVYLKVVVFA